MKRPKTSISKATSYRETGEFWDTHDLSRVWNKTRKVEFTVEIESEATYFAVEKELSDKVRSLARQRGVSSDTLVNLWIQEKLHEPAAG